jgi:hypothetical protein
MAHVFQRKHFLLLLLVSSITSYAKSENGSVARYEEPRSLTATIYSLDRKTVLFKFSRRSTRLGNQLEVIREYTYSDGKLAARERVFYSGDQLQSYELDEVQTGLNSRAKITPDSDNPARKVVLFESSKGPGNLKRRSEPLRNDTLNDDMLGQFLAEHWNALKIGEEVKFRMIIASRAETIGFRLIKESETQRQGKAIVIFRMEPTSPVIRALVDPLHFNVETDGPHHVLEYSGRTTPKVKSGNKWEDLDAVTVFDW